MSVQPRQRLLSTIEDNREKAISFLRKMISIPSVTGDEAAIQDFLATYLAGIGLDVDKWETDWEELRKHPGYRPVDRGYEGRPNIVATLKGFGRGTLTAAEWPHGRDPRGPYGAGWTDNPLVGDHANGRVYGRGSADMKSGVASHIMAVEFLLAARTAARRATSTSTSSSMRRLAGTAERLGYHHPRIQGRRRHFRPDQRPRGAAGVHRAHMVRD